MAAGDKKTSELSSVTTLATGAQVAFLNNGTLIRAQTDVFLNDTNNRFWLNSVGLGGQSYDSFGNAFGRFHVVSGNLWASGVGAWLEGTNLRVNTSGYIFQLIGGATSNNVYNSTTSSIAGGTSNNTHSDRSFIANGDSNLINSHYSSIGGGTSNTITGDGWSVIAGGLSNRVSGAGSVIGGGGDNFLSTASYTVIGGGANNIIEGSSSNHASILGGKTNNINISPYSVVCGGITNTIVNGYRNAIVGGDSNINSGVYGFIGCGLGNKIGYNNFYPVVAGGFYNSIGGAGADSSVVVGGASNTISATPYAVICGGQSNQVYAGSYNFIGGGQSNITSGNYSANIGGNSNYSNKNYNLTWGRKSYAVDAGATVFSDQRDIRKDSQGVDTFNLFYTGGAYLSGTPLYVLGAEAYISGKFAIGMSNVPASASSVGRKGEVTFDTSSAYFCTATNTWKSISLNTFGSDPAVPVSNVYDFKFGSGVANYLILNDNTWETVTFSITSPAVVIPATAGTANYVLDSQIFYLGSVADNWYFRFHDGTSPITNSTIGPLRGTSEPRFDIANIRVPYSTSSSKTVVLQVSVDNGLLNSAKVAPGSSISYMRMT